MPVSPMLSNLLLKQFDERLEKAGITAVRYADDIAVFADSRKACEIALETIQVCLAEVKLSVPGVFDGGKTSILGPSEAAEFLGVEIRRNGEKYKLCAPTSKISKMESSMSAKADIKKCIEEKRNIGQIVSGLDSFIVGHAASMAVLDDGGDFMARLEAAKRRQLRALLVDLLGERGVDSLDNKKLAILGIEAFK
jgi:hypothetical protein